MVIFIITIGVKIGEAITIFVGQIDTLDRDFDIFGDCITNRSVDIDRRAIAFENVAGAAIRIDVTAPIAYRTTRAELAIVII